MAGKTETRPKMQGNLDGLCGMYAVVNMAIKICPRVLTAKAPRGVADVPQTQELFRTLCNTLSKEKNQEMADLLVDGVDFDILGRLIEAASKFLGEHHGLRIKHEKAFGKNGAGLDEFWTKMVDHISDQEGRSIILGLDGQHSHWTCVGSITDKQISLVDSDGLKRLNRKSCTTAEKGRKDRKNIVCPQETYLISVV